MLERFVTGHVSFNAHKTFGFTASQAEGRRARSPGRPPALAGAEALIGGRSSSAFEAGACKKTSLRPDHGRDDHGHARVVGGPAIVLASDQASTKPSTLTPPPTVVQVDERSTFLAAKPPVRRTNSGAHRSDRLRSSR